MGYLSESAHMRYIDSIVLKFILKFFHPPFEFLYLLLSAFPAIFLRKHLINIKIFSQFSGDDPHRFIQLCFHVLTFESELHDFLLVFLAGWAVAFDCGGLLY